MFLNSYYYYYYYYYYYCNNFISFKLFIKVCCTEHLRHTSDY